MSGVFSNAPQLNVEFGKTSIQDLQAFQEQVNRSGGGDIRAKANSDGSYTLYVHKNDKASLRSVFGENYKAEQRQSKRELAKTVIAEVLTRKLPDYGVKMVMSSVNDQPNVNLSQILDDARLVMETGVPDSVLRHYSNLNQIQGNPKLLGAFTSYLDSRLAGENIKFLTLLKAFETAPNPHAKLQIATQMMDMIPPLHDGGDVFGGGPETINIPGDINQQIHNDIAILQQNLQVGVEPAPDDLQRLNHLFDGAKAEVVGMINGNNFVESFAATPEFRSAVTDVYIQNQFTIPSEHPESNLAPGMGERFVQAREDFMENEFPDIDPPLTPAQVDKIIVDRLLSEELDIRPNMAPNERGWDRFEGVELQSSGGATGSGRAKVGGRYYQVKSSIEHAGLGRRLKAWFKNHENYGEVIASNIARAMMAPGSEGLIPKVALRQNFVSKETVVTSEYLQNGKGDLKALYNERVGPLPEGQRHPKIRLGVDERSGHGVLTFNGEAAQDIRRNIALSALLGDHDVNPGNMIALKDGRVGRIDFGHAFNELITGIGGRTTGGGGVLNTKNRILDFFNRETISGLTSAQQTPKLWRDYEGASASAGMTEAMRELAMSQTQIQGIAIAKAQFTDMLAGLRSEDTRSARKQITDLTESLKKLSANIGFPVTSEDPDRIVTEVFNNIERFVLEGQAMLMDVSNLSDLQTRIDDFIANSDAETPIPEDLQHSYQQLIRSSVGLDDGSGLTFMKMSRDVPAFKGSLQQYIDARRAGQA